MTYSVLKVPLNPNQPTNQPVENVNVLMYMIASDEWYVTRKRCNGGECKQECLRVTVQ